MLDVMLQLGDFQFSVSTAAYQTLKRSTEYRWAAQTRIGTHDALQTTGYGPDSITLPGVIYPEHRGGIGQLNTLRAIADRREPLLLASGLGDILGDWVIERIDEDQSTFANRGVPKKQKFTIKIRQHYG